ncbi:hypothetical protein [Paracoccus laeviglucosivorans]|uniref:Uncharacterized protein n=1 Tax=Paracoccus laeviglucosivorans TaxID=1197861 RepID=A0A521ARH4_9RHOB|nr:hypothetical protein [Paracoccus laeviglucosivorans]SMO37386.1 hypothetical protein SAMN06265221_101282 [Paracoccus laeviglucosivorans]
MKHAVLAFGLGIATASVAVAADPAVLAEGAKAVAICAENMPDIRKTKAALNDAGFRLDESDGRLHAYTRKGARIVVGITTPSARKPACMTVVSKMTPTEAQMLMQPWIKASHAQPIKALSKDHSFSHVGSFKGGPVVISVVNHAELKIVRGAAVIAVGLNNQ